MSTGMNMFDLEAAFKFLDDHDSVRAVMRPIVMHIAQADDAQTQAALERLKYVAPGAAGTTSVPGSSHMEIDNPAAGTPPPHERVAGFADMDALLDVRVGAEVLQAFGTGVRNLPNFAGVLNSGTKDSIPALMGLAASPWTFVYMASDFRKPHEPCSEFEAITHAVGNFPAAVKAIEGIRKALDARVTKYRTDGTVVRVKDLLGAPIFDAWTAPLRARALAAAVVEVCPTPEKYVPASIYDSLLARMPQSAEAIKAEWVRTVTDAAPLLEALRRCVGYKDMPGMVPSAVRPAPLFPAPTRTFMRPDAQKDAPAAKPAPHTAQQPPQQPQRWRRGKRGGNADPPAPARAQSPSQPKQQSQQPAQGKAAGGEGQRAGRGKAAQAAKSE
jgi:hypothetical protein